MLNEQNIQEKVESGYSYCILKCADGLTTKLLARVV
jgi:hypothetical protein